ncbi:MAG: hypothetical protein H0V92_12990 [Pseudonocardiales bacterium]|nr:hypothetical protein [Pseudonocardiales bacterium]
MINRRGVLRSTSAAATGAALLGALGGWLEPLAGWSARTGSAFSTDEVVALERVVTLFRDWRTAGAGLGPSAVLGHLGDVSDRLRGAPDDALTGRVFLAGAELAKIAASMHFDTGAHQLSQRYYVIAVQMATAAKQRSFAATVLAALARQCYDLGATADGLEIVGLAQHGTRHNASPTLRAMLATRLAWGHAQRGEVYAFHRAVGAAEESFAARQLARPEPHWLAGLDVAEMAGVIGARFRDLAHHEPTQAHHAATYISRALALRALARTRNRAFDLIGLARVHLLTGEPERGCALVGEALPMIDQRHPGRVGRKLADWNREATRYTSLPIVRDTQDRVCALATAT